jgi:hypothetical protein
MGITALDVTRAGHHGRVAAYWGLPSDNEDSMDLLSYDAAEPGGIVGVMLRFDSPGAAIATFSNLAIESHSSLSIFQLERTDHYYVLGYAHLVNNLRQTAENEIFLEIPDDTDITDLVSSWSFDEVAQKVEGSSSSVRGRMAMIPARTHLLQSQYAAHVFGSRMVNEDSPQLAAALAANRTADNGNEQVWAYCLVLSYMTPGERDVADLYRMVCNALLYDDPVERARLQNDIGTVAHWLKFASITEGANLDTQAVREFRLPPQGENIPEIRKIMSVWNPNRVRTYQDIFRSHRGEIPSPDLGDIAAWMTIPDPPPAELVPAHIPTVSGIRDWLKSPPRRVP